MEPITSLPLQLPHLPLYLATVAAGFPSPAEDYVDRELDLGELLVQHPTATFFCRVAGDSMIDAGIHDGDILIVDRAENPAHGDVVVAVIDGGLTCKYLDKHNRRLTAANPIYPPIPILEGMDVVIEGVVKHSIRCHRN